MEHGTTGLKKCTGSTDSKFGNTYFHCSNCQTCLSLCIVHMQILESHSDIHTHKQKNHFINKIHHSKHLTPGPVASELAHSRSYFIAHWCNFFCVNILPHTEHTLHLLTDLQEKQASITSFMG